MLGLIITGHGEFSSGLIHSARMIAGTHEHVENVVFADGMDLAVLQEQIGALAAKHVEAYGGTIILTDLKGGTPFNVSMMATATLENVAVLSGTNLPMIIEGTLLSQFSDSADDLAAQLVQVGRDGVDRPQLNRLSQQEVAEDEDGI
ncbi:MAG: PTS sugar transporter subunit IIA [Aerococcaceae bacterium]|nr:PTS sugar transporter subunit IIA [Aerococcaceae bacterium]